MSDKWEVVICVDVPSTYNAQEVQDFVEEKGVYVIQLTRQFKGKGKDKEPTTDLNLPTRLLVEDIRISPSSVEVQLQDSRDANEKFYMHLNRAMIRRIKEGVARYGKD